MARQGNRLVLAALVLALVAALAVPPVGQASSAHAAATCGRFIVGQANSSAYRGFKLPARGTATRASCKTLRRIARRLHSGRYRIPDGAFANAPRWGSVFRIHDAGRSWSCRFQSRGGSGPSYAVRCRHGSAHIRWSTG